MNGRGDEVHAVVERSGVGQRVALVLGAVGGGKLLALVAAVEHGAALGAEGVEVTCDLRHAYGLQHVLAMYAGAVAVPLIVANALGLSREQHFLINADCAYWYCDSLIQTLGFWNMGNSDSYDSRGNLLRLLRP